MSSTTSTTDDIRLGSKKFNFAEVFSAKPPSKSEMVTFCHTLKLLIESGVNILDALAIMTKSVEHPWLLAALYFGDQKTREGETLTESIAKGFQELIELRVEEICARESKPGNWREFEQGQWAIPDFFGQLADLLSMIDVGEETGEVHTALQHVADINLDKGGYGERTWGEDIAFLNRAMAIMYVAGLPPHAIVRVLRGLPSLKSLRSELEIVAASIDDSQSLSHAFAKTNGRLADPVYVGLIEAGEEACAVWKVFGGMSIA